MAWEVGNLVNFTPTGDTTATAIKKSCIDEVAKIYIHLNELNGKVTGEATLNVLPAASATPAMGECVEVITDDAYNVKVKADSGSSWPVLASRRLAPRSTDMNDGVVRYGNASNVVSKLVDSSKAVSTTDLISEEDFASVINITGITVPRGSVIMWWGDETKIPSGWALCNGQNGTPDYRGKFLRGLSDDKPVGANKVTLAGSALPAHTHGLDVIAESAKHSHVVSAAVSNSDFSHNHSGGARVTNFYEVGNHNHTPGDYLYDYKNGGDMGGNAYTLEYFRPYTETFPSAGAHSHSWSTSVGVGGASETHKHTMSAVASEGGDFSVDSSGETGTAKDESTIEIDITPSYMSLLHIMKL